MSITKQATTVDLSGLVDALEDHKHPNADVGNHVTMLDLDDECYYTWKRHLRECSRCSSEPTLIPNNSRFVLFPIKYQEFYRLFKKNQAALWTTEEINFVQDKADWLDLSTTEEGRNLQHFIKTVLAFFASSDGIVNENLVGNFMEQVQLPEARLFYGLQIYIEGIHGETYSTMIDIYAKDREERQRLFNALENVPCVRAKADWALKHFNKRMCYRHRLWAFIIMEGLFFSASFCAIHYLKSVVNKLPGLQFSNNLIAKDENNHAVHGCMLYTMLDDPLPHVEAQEIIRDAVAVEMDYVREGLRADMIGMNVRLMEQYVHFIADQLLSWIGVPPVFGRATNPFPWMLLGIASKNNMFELRGDNYQKAGVMAKLDDPNADEYTTDADF